MNSPRSYDTYDHDQLFTSDRSSLPITHNGSISLNLSPHLFKLQNVLCLPDATKNLIFVSQFRKSINVLIEFLSNLFLLKDLRVGRILEQGRNRDDVYEFVEKIKPILKPQLYVYLM